MVSSQTPNGLIDKNIMQHQDEINEDHFSFYKTIFLKQKGVQKYVIDNYLGQM